MCWFRHVELSGGLKFFYVVFKTLGFDSCESLTYPRFLRAPRGGGVLKGHERLRCVKYIQKVTRFCWSNVVIGLVEMLRILEASFKVTWKAGYSKGGYGGTHWSRQIHRWRVVLLWYYAVSWSQKSGVFSLTAVQPLPRPQRSKNLKNLKTPVNSVVVPYVRPRSLFPSTSSPVQLPVCCDCIIRVIGSIK